jgi:hypothetical protein
LCGCEAPYLEDALSLTLLRPVSFACLEEIAQRNESNQAALFGSLDDRELRQTRFCHPVDDGAQWFVGIGYHRIGFDQA